MVLVDVVGDSLESWPADIVWYDSCDLFFGKYIIKVCLGCRRIGSVSLGAMSY